MFKALSIALVLAAASPAFAQKAKPDFSLLTPEWAAGETDRNFQNSETKVVWQAFKRNFPDDYQAFIVEYANATLKHESLAPISGRFIQDHTVGVLDLARKAPDPELARMQRQRAKLIEYLAGSNVAACAAMARSSTGLLAGDFGQDSDPRIAAMLYDNLAVFVDAAGAGRDRPTSRTPVELEVEDTLLLKALLVSQGVSSQDANAILSEEAYATDDAQACRYGVAFYKVMMIAPDKTAAKFAIR